MKRKLPLFILILSMVLSTATNLNAQIDSFKLADYKLPDLKRQGIDISFDLRGNRYNNNYFDDESNDNSSSSFSNQLYGNYFIFKNTKHYQGNHSFALHSSYSLSSSGTDNYENIQNGYGTNINIYSANRFYFHKLFFWGVDFYGGIANNNRLDHDKNYQNSILLKKVKDSDLNNKLSAEIPLSIGKGRIEPVEDARHAIYLLKDLEKNNRLTREPTKSEILFLSEKISEIKNKRVLDARLKKIYELKQLDSILLSMKLINESDITYFTSINDIWDFGGLQPRNAGYRLAFSISPSLNYSKSKNKYDFEDYQLDSSYNSETKGTLKYYAYSAGVNFTREKPFRQIFQSSFSSSVNYRWQKHEYSNEEITPNPSDNNSESIEKNITAQIRYALGIYPSTRTYFSVGASISGVKNWHEIPDATEDSNYDGFFLSNNCFTSVNYYFSPKLRLNFFYNFSYNRIKNRYSNDDEQENFYHNVNLTLHYSIF